MRWVAILATLLSAPAGAQEEAPSLIASVTITSNVAASCSVTFDNPMLGIAWARVVFREMPPEKYLELWNLTFPGKTPEQKAHVRDMVNACMGDPA
jgi:hypothetical protein